ncbi:hypothetical protein E2C01_008296 [Portunus trituberculatus]|uniref:Uncharacterized protein n=1 Tax=Portunus trituberculatus TaxID=210409 RepID=A0A5B7D3K6_PORTR|nr:hypothetical protein [Portunus trituberculatus]
MDIKKSSFLHRSTEAQNELEGDVQCPHLIFVSAGQVLHNIGFLSGTVVAVQTLKRFDPRVKQQVTLQNVVESCTKKILLMIYYHLEQDSPHFPLGRMCSGRQSHLPPDPQADLCYPGCLPSGAWKKWLSYRKNGEMCPCCLGLGVPVGLNGAGGVAPLAGGRCAKSPRTDRRARLKNPVPLTSKVRKKDSNLYTTNIEPQDSSPSDLLLQWRERHGVSVEHSGKGRWLLERCRPMRLRGLHVGNMSMGDKLPHIPSHEGTRGAEERRRDSIRVLGHTGGGAGVIHVLRWERCCCWG